MTVCLSGKLQNIFVAKKISLLETDPPMTEAEVGVAEEAEVEPDVEAVAAVAVEAVDDLC